MNEQKTFAKGTFWALLSQFITKFLGFLYMVIIARFLPPETIGLFYVAISVLGILYVFSDLGIVYALGRYIPYFYGKNQFENIRRLVRFSYFGGSGLTIIFSIVVFLLAETISMLLNQPNLSQILKVLSVWLFFQEFFDINRGILNGMKRFRESQLLDVFLNILRFLLTIVAFYFIGFNLDSLIFPYLGAFGVTAIVAFYYAKKQMLRLPDKEKRKNTMPYPKLAKEIIKFGFTTMLIFMLWMIIQHTDKLMLTYMLGEGALKQVAVYTIAIGFASLILIFPSAISAIFFPIVSELHGKNDLITLQKIVSLSIKWMLLFLLPILVLIISFPEELLSMFYGSAYKAGWLALVIFSLGILFRSIGLIIGLTIAAFKRLDIELKAAAVGVFLNIVLNIVFIPAFGLTGAALASSLTLAVVSILLFYYMRTFFRMQFPSSIAKLFLSALATFIILLLAKPFIMSYLDIFSSIAIFPGEMGSLLTSKIIKLIIFGLLFAVASAVYFIGLIIFNAFEKDEIDMLKAVLRRLGVPEKYRKLANFLLRQSNTRD